MKELNKQFGEIEETFKEIREKIPHVKVREERRQEDEDPFIKKMKKWLLIGLTVLIAGTAAILIVWRLLSRFL